MNEREMSDICERLMRPLSEMAGHRLKLVLRHVVEEIDRIERDAYQRGFEAGKMEKAE